MIAGMAQLFHMNLFPFLPRSSKSRQQILQLAQPVRPHLILGFLSLCKMRQSGFVALGLGLMLQPSFVLRRLWSRITFCPPRYNQHETCDRALPSAPKMQGI